MTQRVRVVLSCALGLAMAVALAPARPAWADAITRVKGAVVDNHGKPLVKVTLYFEAVEIKKRVGPLRTGKDGAFVIATLDISVAKKWKLIPQLEGYKTVKVSYEVIDSEESERGKGDVLLNSKQEYPDLSFALVGTEGRNIVNFVMAKEAEFNAALTEERKKKEGSAGTAPTGAAAAPGSPAPQGAAAAVVPVAAVPVVAPPPGGKETLEQAKKLTDAGRHQEAVELYRSYVAKDPNGNPAVYYYMGKSLFESDDLRGAEQSFRKGLQLKQDMKGAHFYLGNIALKDDRPAEAILEFEKELAFSPDSDSVYFNLGKAYEQSGNDAKALEMLEKAAVLNTTKPEPLMQMAAIHEKQRDAAATPQEKSAAAAQAGAVYDRIKAIDPKNAAILFFNVGAKAKNENRMKDAAQAFQKSVEIDPTYAPAHREFGYALVGTQDFAGAIRQFQEYLKLSPSAPDAKDIQQTIAALK